MSRRKLKFADDDYHENENRESPIRDTGEFEDVEMPVMDGSMTKTLENLDQSMRITVELDFDNSCFIQDQKQIDYVLVYEEEDMELEQNGEKTEAQKRAERRKHFEEDLISNWGLELTEVVSDPMGADSDPNSSKPIKVKWQPRTRVEEHTSCLSSFHKWLRARTTKLKLVGRTHYILVHAPFAVLEKQAQLLNVQLPVKKCDVEASGRSFVPDWMDSCLEEIKCINFADNLKEQLEEPDYYSASYAAENKKKFLLWDKPEYMFPSSERSRLVHDLLLRARYLPNENNMSQEDNYRVGIDRLIAKETYTAAYPLHQRLRSSAEIAEDNVRAELDGTKKNMSQRELLKKCWASKRCILKFQPLDLIKRYFGSKIGLYFAWLGYYTKILYPAAFMGLVCFLFGISQFGQDEVSKEVCSADKVYQCPQCTTFCDFKPLNESCFKAQMTYVFDNVFTVVFAALMSVWSSLFLEGWKRYHAEIAWKWGLNDFAVEEDLVRSEFLHRVKTTRYNPVTGKQEPYLSRKKQILNFAASGVSVVFFIFLVLAVVFGMVVYKSIVTGLLQKLDYSSDVADYTVQITASILNLIVIQFMNWLYYVLAHLLTRWECPRTQNDFDNSFTIKVFLFQFANYYSSFFYIAFFKRLISQLPPFSYGVAKVSGGALKIENTQIDGCDAVGCFYELVIQMFITMTGRQLISGFSEMGMPFLEKKFRQWKFLVKRENTEKENKSRDSAKQRWEEDYFLTPTYDQWLFDEYLEMVIQFGFITLFVAAFPLAPLFALLNNVFEIRLDAYKFLVTTQRPVPAQSRNIGIWLHILQFISNISVTVNAFLIAFTSDFVPRTYYKFMNNGHLSGYLDWSLSHFSARHVTMNRTFSNYTETEMIDCRFRGFRKLPCMMKDAGSTVYFTPFNNSSELYLRCDPDDSYDFSDDFWRILALRLAFVVVFEHVVFLIKTIVDYLIPDVPTKIFVQQQREKYLKRNAACEKIASRQGSMCERKHKTARSNDEAASYSEVLEEFNFLDE